MKTIAPLLFAVGAFAASPFDGTWKLDLGTVKFPEKPNTLATMNGMYSCSSCVPPVTGIKADGTDQSVTGQRYDQISVRIVNPRTLRLTLKKNSRIVTTEEVSVDESGNRLTSTRMEYPENAQPFNVTALATRVEKGPPGSHATSGSWRWEKIDAPASVLLFTFKMNGSDLSMNDSVGKSYTAKFDGKDYPVKGDPSADTVSLRRVNENTLEETLKRVGKVVEVDTSTVSPDGRSMVIAGDDKRQGTTVKVTAAKQ